MPKRVKFELELPDAVLDALGEESLSSKTKEALVMQLLREHRIPQGKAAHLMGISRYDIFPLMAKYQISFIDERELDEELNSDFRNGCRGTIGRCRIRRTAQHKNCEHFLA